MSEKENHLSEKNIRDFCTLNLEVFVMRKIITKIVVMEHVYIIVQIQIHKQIQVTQVVFVQVIS